MSEKQLNNIFRTTKCFGVNGQGKIKGAFPKGFLDTPLTPYNSLYWKICNALSERNGKTNKQIIAMIEEMLEAVKTKWKEGEKK